MIVNNIHKINSISGKYLFNTFKILLFLRKRGKAYVTALKKTNKIIAETMNLYIDRLENEKSDILKLLLLH